MKSKYSCLNLRAKLSAIYMKMKSGKKCKKLAEFMSGSCPGVLYVDCWSLPDQLTPFRNKN